MGTPIFRCHKCQTGFHDVETLRKHTKTHPSTKRKRNER